MEEASLQYIDASGQSRLYPVRGHEVTIGRDPQCGVPVQSGHASWHHATIRRDGHGIVLTELGSTNGTSVNGAPVHGSVVIQSGDRILIAGDVELVLTARAASNEESQSARFALTAGVVIMLVAGLVAGAFFLTGGAQKKADPEMAKAVSLAEKGITHARAGERIEARDALRAAAGQLYTAGYLDNVPRGDLQREAMRLLQDRIDVSFDLWSFYDNVLRQAQESRPAPTTPIKAERCRLDRVNSNELDQCLQDWIRHVLEDIRQDTDTIPPDFYRVVGRRLRVENDFIRRSIVRGEPLVPMLMRELEAAKMPPLLHYVALIESGYQNSATSTAAAAGLWQFMPATGRQYGLKVKGNVDERRDTEKSTRAAARYLRDLAFEFGGDALLLALAGYNRGENGVRRSLKKLDDPFSDRSYWRLVEKDLLPDETQAYVPRFIAAAVAGEGGLPSKQVLRDAGY